MISKLFLLFSLYFVFASAENFLEFGDFNDRCGLAKKYFASANKFRWAEATDLCSRNGMTFASLTLPGESDNMRDLLTRTISVFDRSGTNSYAEILHVNARTTVARSKRDFRWVPTPFITLERDVWGPGEPNNAGNEFCASIMSYGSGNSRFFAYNDIACDDNNHRHRVICEKNLRLKN